MEYFKLVHAPTWKIPHFMIGFLSICTRHKAFGIFNNFLLSATPSYPLRYIFWTKMNFTWNISSWCMPQIERFLNIWNFIYSYVQDIESSVSSTFLRYLQLPNVLKGTFFFWKKMIFSWNISSWCMPQLEIFLIIWQVFYPYVQGMKHSVSLIVLRYLRLPYALYGTFFGKRWFLMKYFKLVHAPTWKIPYFMRGFLFICTRHEAFGIFNIFALSATP